MKKIFLMMVSVIALTACTASSEKKSEAADNPAEETAEAAKAPVDNTPFNYPRTGGVIEYKADKFGETIRPDATLPVVIDFNATWCGPCKRFEPTFDKVAEEWTDAIFLSVDVDENPVAAQQFEVTNIPLVVVLMPDGTTSRQVGFMEEDEFKSFLGI